MGSSAPPPSIDSLIAASRILLEVTASRLTDREAMASYFNIVDRIIIDQGGYQALLECRGSEAQIVLDALQSLLPSLDGSQKAQVLKAHLRLSKRSSLLPRSFSLHNIDHVRRIYGSPSVDIYRAHHNGLSVCLKRYRFYTGVGPDKVTELLNREAIIWANHRHIGLLPFSGVYLLDNGMFECGVYLVSPFLEHGTITEYLSTHPGVDRRLLAKDVCDAVAYLHENSIVHGDIKGANILVHASGRACVADLGYSRLKDATILTWTTVQSVASVGTVPWQAPELLRAQCDGIPFTPTPEADVYSLGCLCYEVFTDKAPFWHICPGAWSPWRVNHIIDEIIIKGGLPERPGQDSEAYSVCGLTEQLWGMMEMCWCSEASLRPSAFELSQMAPLADIPDNRPFHEY